MKVVAGVVAAGALASAVAVSASLGKGGDGEPAPVNPYKGMQTREEVFEFTTKPAVKKEGDKYVITFTSKGKCDATVAILDKDGKVIRHLASGVLGANAPHPFQQNSLSQKIEWDGQTDTFKKAPAGCKVKVSLGLKPEFERNIGWDLYETCFTGRALPPGRAGQLILGTTADGNTAIINTDRFGDYGRVYDKDGKYLRSFFPPPAEKLEKVMSGLGYGFVATQWGDKTIMANWFGPFIGAQGDVRRKPFLEQHADPIAAAKALEGVKEVKLGERPANLQAEKYPWPKDKRQPNTIGAIHVKVPRMVVDRTREELYTYGGRFDGKTGELDPSWVYRGIEMAVGFDGLVYLRMGGHGSGGIVRLKRDGTIVPFPKGVQAAPPKHGYWQWVCTKVRAKNPDLKFLAHGCLGQSQTWQCGLDVGPNGDILAVLSNKHASDMEEYAKAATGGPDGRGLDNRVWKGAKPNLKGMFLTVYNTEGEIVTRRAVEGATYGSGAFLDRDGSIYVNQGMVLPPDHKLTIGLAAPTKGPRGGQCGKWLGSVLKFRGQGGAYPVGKLFGKSSLPATEGAPGADALKVKGYRTAAEGALWAYGAAPGSAGDSCACDHNRFDLDDWARSWIPMNQLNSVMVVDANGNRILRVGRYGNIDDADEKYGKIHFAWIRTTAASDTALYVVDSGNRRVLKAALKYAAEEELPLP